jgi:ribosomal-protein-alanine N-acetyltransferase
VAIQLVRLDPALEKTIASQPGYMDALIHDQWSRVAELVHQVVGRVLTAVPVAVDQLRWSGYFVIDEDTREVIGSCAFKSPPTAEGVVEIAYFTYPGFEGRGYATAMATKLIGSRAARRMSGWSSPTRFRSRAPRLGCCRRLA